MIHLKLVDCPLWVAVPSQSMGLGANVQIMSFVSIFIYVDKTKNSIYVDKVRQYLHFCNVSYKNKGFLRRKI